MMFRKLSTLANLGPNARAPSSVTAMSTITAPVRWIWAAIRPRRVVATPVPIVTGAGGGVGAESGACPSARVVTMRLCPAGGKRRRG